MCASYARHNESWKVSTHRAFPLRPYLKHPLPGVRYLDSVANALLFVTEGVDFDLLLKRPKIAIKL
jgi:hypothetical protein